MLLSLLKILLQFHLLECSFEISVCDNCTITLLESSRDLEYFVQTETRQIDLNSVPAPWSRLISYENASEHLFLRLDDIIKSTEKIENYNDLQIDKVNTCKSLHPQKKKHTRTNCETKSLFHSLFLSDSSPVEFEGIKFANEMAKNVDESSKTKPNVG